MKWKTEIINVNKDTGEIIIDTTNYILINKSISYKRINNFLSIILITNEFKHNGQKTINF